MDVATHLYMHARISYEDQQSRSHSQTGDRSLLRDSLSLITLDVSRGLEPVAVRLEGECPSFVYIAENELPGGVDCVHPDSSGCDCEACDEQCGCSTEVGGPFESSSACDCSQECSNRVAQAGVRLSLVVRPSVAGLGLYADQDITEGQFVCCYIGEVIGRHEARRRWAERKGTSNYILALRETGDNVVMTTIIDPTTRGNCARFINHSCSPNLEIRAVRPIGSIIPLAAMYASRDAHTGEQLSFDYGSTSEGQSSTPCLCESVDCRGFLPFDPSL